MDYAQIKLRKQKETSYTFIIKISERLLDLKYSVCRKVNDVEKASVHL